jgi:hypothetical protein
MPQRNVIGRQKHDSSRFESLEPFRVTRIKNSTENSSWHTESPFKHPFRVERIVSKVVMKKLIVGAFEISIYNIIVIIII